MQNPRNPDSLRFHRLWLGLGIGFLGTVAWLSLMPDPPDFGHAGGFKFDHATTYGCLMLWFAQLYRGWRTRWLWAAGICLMGVALEYLQGLTDYRGFEYSDMLINATGVCAGLLLALTPLQHLLRVAESFIPCTSRQSS